MTAWGVLAGLVFPEGLMQTPWFADLSAFVSINTVAYVTLAIIKTLPKAYLSDWVDRRERRTENRSIFPDTGPLR
ncbi:MAG: hypothetical protein JJE52_00440 [Acidimicrobiia bacterium]|nr:hypothetical protein [Acidimicrobiia bacterium]